MVGEPVDAARVAADGLGLKGPRGWVFREVGVEAEPGALITIEGASGSGRTCLLLALTGRMRATEGTASVGGARLPRKAAAVRRVSALANVAGVTDLDPALTVGEHLRERALLQQRFGDSLRALLRPGRERTLEARLRIDAALAAAGLDREALPKGSRTAVRDLERLEALRLSIALALVGRPGLLGVDDADLKLSAAERAEVWALLRSIADAGTTVVAVCSEAPGGTVEITTRATEETTAAATGERTSAEETSAEKPTDGPPSAAETSGEKPTEEENPASGEPTEQPGANENKPADDPADNPEDNPADSPAEKGPADAFAATGRA
ncbi:ATP-binding cassette domain-containing protein [Streptomyces mangrovisoli]|uniref:ABC transporter ATP-binding protein n=1 Tax=Streptomyces mangrovisoli TaxID=1428628 RepID=A0A1J4P4V2_9ACTN|nr:ATP-binding cassette domain-containing protein [Streptomyces mangrovisoli]OIJ68764.1 ABC transporter ATP-binding protein [Streptomyces mangrovisoli]